MNIVVLFIVVLFNKIYVYMCVIWYRDAPMRPPARPAGPAPPCHVSSCASHRTAVASTDPSTETSAIPSPGAVMLGYDSDVEAEVEERYNRRQVPFDGPLERSVDRRRPTSAWRPPRDPHPRLAPGGHAERRSAFAGDLWRGSLRAVPSCRLARTRRMPTHRRVGSVQGGLRGCLLPQA